MFFLRYFPCLLAGLLFSSTATSAELTALPDPLTMDIALQLAENAGHYQNRLAEQAIQQSLAEAQQSQSLNDVSVSLDGRLGASQSPGSSSPENDSAIKLFVRKPLYDFGKSAASDEVAHLNIELKRLEKQYLIEQRRLDIRQKYFDVLNADNQYLRDNEELAIGFIRYDRTRDNQKLGLASALDVSKTKAAYERIRQNRYNSENMQRLTRVILAQALGFADSPPNELAVPKLDSSTRIKDDVGAMVKQALQHSLKLRIEQKKLQIAKKQIEVARHTDGAKLDAELELADYAQDRGNRDKWRASLYLNVPLYTGSRKSAAVNLASARYQQQLAALLRAQSEIRIEVLKLWQAIRQNRLRVEGGLVEQDYRDMVLDRSRAEYDLEFKTDLGNSMVQFSESRRKTWQAKFALEMSWRKLEVLLGKDYLQQIKLKKKGDNG